MSLISLIWQADAASLLADRGADFSLLDEARTLILICVSVSVSLINHPNSSNECVSCSRVVSFDSNPRHAAPHHRAAPLLFW